MGQNRMEFLVVVSWFYRYYDDYFDSCSESIRLYEPVPEQTTMFITSQDSHGEIDAAEPDQDHADNHQLQS